MSSRIAGLLRSPMANRKRNNDYRDVLAPVMKSQAMLQSRVNRLNKKNRDLKIQLNKLADEVKQLKTKTLPQDMPAQTQLIVENIVANYNLEPRRRRFTDPMKDWAIKHWYYGNKSYRITRC